MALSEAGTVRFMTESTSISPKVAFDRRRSLDVISTTLKCWVQPREEIIQVRSDDAHSLLQRSCGTAHYESQGEHCPRKKLNRNLQNNEMCFLAPVVLRKGIDEGEKKSLSEDVGTKNQASNHLWPVS